MHSGDCEIGKEKESKGTCCTSIQAQGTALWMSPGAAAGQGRLRVETRPQKRMLWVLMCLMRNRKGWLQQKLSEFLPALSIISTPVAAEASVPSSLTSTKHLWTTSDTTRLRFPVMPEKSITPSRKASTIPRARSLKNCFTWIPALPSKSMVNDGNTVYIYGFLWNWNVLFVTCR